MHVVLFDCSPEVRNARLCGPRGQPEAETYTYHGALVPKLKIERSVLAATDPEYLVGRAIAPAYAHVSVCDGPAELGRALAALTPGQRHLVAIHWRVVEVCNGGFEQLFSSPAGMLSAEAHDGFRAAT